MHYRNHVVNRYVVVMNVWSYEKILQKIENAAKFGRSNVIKSMEAQKINVDNQKVDHDENPFDKRQFAR